MSEQASRAVTMVDGLPRAASRDEKISLSESNIILQQATIDPEHAKNYLYVLGTEMIIARDPTVGFGL